MPREPLQSTIDTDFLLFLVHKDEKFRQLIASHAETANPRSSVFEERLAMANKLVDEGNAQFKLKQYPLAQKLYMEAGYQVDFDFGQQFEMTETHLSQVRVCKIRILLNVCNNLLNMQEFGFVKLVASLGIQLAKANDDLRSEPVGKFYYRRGRAFFETKDFKLATADLAEAQKIVPTDQSVKQLLNQATAESKKQQAESDQLWKGKKDIFEKYSEKMPSVDVVYTDGPDEGQSDNEESPRRGGLSVVALSIVETMADIVCCRRRRISKFE